VKGAEIDSPATNRRGSNENHRDERDVWDGIKLALDTSMLAIETQQVIGLRFLRLTLGGPMASQLTRLLSSVVTKSKLRLVPASLANVSARQLNPRSR
jgi:hypothetical protein